MTSEQAPIDHRIGKQLDHASGERFAVLLNNIPESKRKRVIAALDDLNAALARADPRAPIAAKALNRAISATDDERRVLSRRESQVLRLVAQGLTSSQVGERLAIGRRTVESHRANISRKLNFKSQADLIRFAVEKGIIPALPRRRSRR